MSGNDSSTKLLLHLDGVAGSTTFTDSSVGGGGHVPVAIGDTQLIASGSAFGGSAAVFDGSGDGIQLPLSSDFDYAAGDFCIDARVRPVSLSGVQYVYRERLSASDKILFYINGSKLVLNLSAGGVSLSLTSSASVSAGVFNHVMFCRIGNDFFLSINGGVEQVGTQSMSFAVGLVSYLGTGQSGNFLNGELDEYRISKGTGRMNDPDDPLYVSSGSYVADGFTPPSSSYSQFSAHDFSDVSLFVPVDAHDFKDILIKKSKDSHDFTDIKLVIPVDAHDFRNVLFANSVDAHDFSDIKLIGEKDGHDFSDIKLAGTVDAHDFSNISIRADGNKAYFFDLRDSSDIQVATFNGAPPTTVFTDLFTGLLDGDYTLYCRSVEKYKNLENTINETFVKFKLVTGLIVLPFPNEVTSIATSLLPLGGVRLTWSYNSSNESVPPDDFIIYIDAVQVQTVAYIVQGDYSIDLPALSEIQKTFKVTAKAATQETSGLTVDATPDATPTASVPFTFEVT